jgi:dTDP-4-amino-4,6-dideoxygalactose transaminase
MSGNELKYVHEAFDQNWIAPLGPNVDALEKSLANYCKVNYAAALSSGSAALHLALILLGVKQADEVIASTFTFSATINPVVYLNAVPILVDSEPETWNMDPQTLKFAIEDRLKKGKKPKAIILVHLYGMPAKIDEILKIADEYEIPLIEDAAEALGSRYKNQPVGSYGKMSVLSFNGNKIITTSGGGALLSDEKKLINKARFLSTQARDKAPHYQHSHVGYNYRMSNILAGIGRGQIEVLDERVIKRRNNFRHYYENLKDFPGIEFLIEPSKDYFSNFWLTTILVDPIKSRTSREKLQDCLEKKNIETRPLWKPMHLQPIFQKYPKYLNGTSDKLFNLGLCLPSGSSLTPQDINQITALIESFNRKRIWPID